MILLIDNYDSFTYNLYQYISEVLETSFSSQAFELKVFRNDKISINEIQELLPSIEAIVISPGPCTPKDAGISCSLIKNFAGKVPILGICLGHQAIAEAFGAQVVQSANPVHGKEALIYHESKNLFKKLPSPLIVGRYHSLEIEKNSLPDDLEVIALSENQEIMAISHKSYQNLIGLQFHPESILTPMGIKLLENFLILHLLK